MVKLLPPPIMKINTKKTRTKNVAKQETCQSNTILKMFSKMPKNRNIIPSIKDTPENNVAKK